jgi:hypothetical protein
MLVVVLHVAVAASYMSASAAKVEGPVEGIPPVVRTRPPFPNPVAEAQLGRRLLRAAGCRGPGVGVRIKNVSRQAGRGVVAARHSSGGRENATIAQ